MKFEKLGHIVKISKGKKHALAPKRAHQNFRYIQIEDLRNNDNLKYTDEKGVEVHENDLIIAWDGANAGTIGFGLSGMIGSTLARLRIKEDKEYNTDFIGYFLKGQFDYLRANATGATIPHIDRGSLESLKIPVLDYPEQYRIAQILSKSEDLTKQRKESIKLLDKFLESTFYEMFGDPVRNEKGWDTDKFGSCLSNILAGSSSTSKLPNDELSALPAKILKVSAVTSGRFNPNEYKDITFSQLGSTLLHPQQGDLLFSRANTRELVGATCIVYENYPDLHLPDKIWILFTNERLSIHYTHYLFQNKSFRNILTRNATGTSGSMLNISMEKLRAQRVPIPDIDLQNKFATIVTDTEVLRKEYLNSLLELENLFGSLNQLAFKGELHFKNTPQKEIVDTFEFEREILTEHLEVEPASTVEPKEDLKKADAEFKFENEKPISTIFDTTEETVFHLIQEHFSDNYFTFQNFREKLIEDKLEYNFEEVKGILFELLRQKKLIQVYASATFKSSFTESDADFKKIKSLEEQMYLQQSAKANL